MAGVGDRATGADLVEPRGGSDLFVCYAREDIGYVEALVAAVRDAGLSVWVDLADIPAADPDWPATVDAAIVASPATMIVLTPDAARSDECRREIDVAVAHGKQIIVVSHRPLNGIEVGDVIRRSNWIAGPDLESIGGTVARIVGAYTVDLVWKRYRAELEVAATRWRDRGEDQSYLLRGNQLDAAAQELAARADDDLPPTELLVSYVDEGRRVRAEENRRRTDAQRVAVATEWIARAPTTAALVLVEVEDPDNVPFALARMNEVLQSWLVSADWQAQEWLSVFDVSSDGELCLSASSDRTARIWRTDGTGDVVTIGGNGQLNAASFSPDARSVVLAGNDGKARIWPSDGSGSPVVFERHGDIVQFSPDGTRLAIASDDGTGRLYRLAGAGSVVDLTPAQIFSHEVDDAGFGTRPTWLHRRAAVNAPGGTAYVGPPSWYRTRSRARLFSPDGRFVVIGSLDGTARIWPSDGSASPVELDHDEAVLSACFSPDGRLVLTGSHDRRARVWPADGSTDPVVLVHESPVITARFSVDGDRVVTGCEDGTARLWSADGTGSPLVFQHGGPVISACFSPQSDRVLTVSMDGAARIWSPDRSAPIVFRHDSDLIAARFGGRGTRVMTACSRGRIRAWSHRPRVFWHRAPVRSVCVSPDGHTILTSTDDGAAHLWRVDTYARALVVQHSEPIVTLSFGPDGRYLVTASRDGTAQICRTDGSEPPRVLPHEGPVTQAVFSPTGEWLATGCKDGYVRLWRVARSEPPILFSPQGSYKGTPLVGSVAFSPAGDRVAAAAGPFVRVWRIDGPDAPLELMGRHYGGYIESVSQAQFSADGDRIVTQVGDKIRIWPADGAGEPVMLTHPGGGGVTVAVVSSDASTVATVSAWDGTACIWNLTAMPQSTEIRHAGSVEDALLSPDAHRLAIITSERAVRIWRTDGTEDPVTLRHEGMINSAAFSDTGHRLVTVSEDGSARVWRSDGSGEPFAVWHEGAVHAAAFSPDGQRIVTASEDRTARLWTLSGDVLRSEIRRLTTKRLDQEFYENHLRKTLQ